MARQALYSIRSIIVASTLVVLNAFALGIDGPAATGARVLEIRQVPEEVDDLVASAAIMHFGCVDVGPAAGRRGNEGGGVDVGEPDVESVEVCYGGNGFVAGVCR